MDGSQKIVSDQGQKHCMTPKILLFVVGIFGTSLMMGPAVGSHDEHLSPHFHVVTSDRRQIHYSTTYGYLFLVRPMGDDQSLAADEKPIIFARFNVGRFGT